MHDPQVLLARRVLEPSASQLLEDNVVDDRLIGPARHEDVDPARCEARPVELCLHHGCGPQQPEPICARFEGGVGGDVHNVHEGDADCRLDLGGDPVEGVRRENQELGSATLQASRSLGQVVGGLVPPLRPNAGLDHREVHAVEQQLRRGVAPEMRVHTFVEPPVVLRASHAAHATEHSNGLHHRILHHGPSVPDEERRLGQATRSAACSATCPAREVLWNTRYHFTDPTRRTITFEPFVNPTPPTTDRELGLAEEPAPLLLRPQQRGHDNSQYSAERDDEREATNIRESQNHRYGGHR